MNKVIFKQFLFIISFLFSTIYSSNFHSVAVILDYGEEEPSIVSDEIIKGKTNFTNVFAQLLGKKSVPVICSGKIVHNFYFRLADFKSKLNCSLEKAYLNYHHLYSLNFEKIREAFELGQILGAELQELLDKEKKKVEDILRRQGLFNNFDYIKSLENNCFLFSMDFDENEWFIFKHIDTDFYLFIPRDYLSYLGLIEEEFSLDILGFSSNFLKNADLEIIQHDSAFVNVDKLCEIFLSKSNDEGLKKWNICLLGHGLKHEAITCDLQCGMSEVSFVRFLKFLNNNLNTNLLYYSTCFGGGSNLERLYENSNYNYHIISGCLGCRAFIHGYPFHVITFKRPYLKEIIDIGSFLCLIPFCQTPEELRSVLQLVTSKVTKHKDLHCITQMPFVRWAESNKFEIVLPYDDLMVVTDQNNSRSIDVFEKRAIFIETEKIEELNIHVYKRNWFDTTTDDQYKSPAIVSIIPGDARHEIGELIVNCEYEKFINESLKSISMEQDCEKEFFIEKLVCIDKTLTNVSFFT